jgi:serine phosphatase RsbU (regulator of sigma subunit)
MRNVKNISSVFFTLILMIFSLGAFSQSTRRIDSLKKVLLKPLHDTVRTSVYIDLGWRYTYVNIDSSFHYNQLAIDLSKKTGDRHDLAAALNDMGIDHYVHGNFKKAIAFLDEAYHLHKKNGDKYGMFQTKTNIGACYNLLKQTDAAIASFKDAKVQVLEMGRTELLPGVELNLASMYLDQNNIEEAGRTIENVISESKKQNNKMMEATALSEYGRYYMKKNNLDSALKYYTTGYNLLLEINQEVNSVQDLNFIAEIYLKKGKPQEALKYATKARDLARANELLNELGSAYGQLTYAYADLHDYKKAWESSMEFKKLSDSLFNNDNSKAVSDIKTKFEVELKEAELNARSEAEKKILVAATEAERTRKRIILFSGIAIVIVISVFSLVLFRKFREADNQKTIIQKQKKQVEEQHRIAEARAVEIDIKKQELETKNREVFDSIMYARNIQAALLPGKDLMGKQIRDHFILFEPKDIIAGDFYWYKKIDEDSFYFAVGDCTGHGVPGALMSVLGINLLEMIFTDSRLQAPSDILNELRKRTVRSLQTASQSGKVNDGMDICIAKIDLKKMELTTAMANNPLVLARKKEAIELKPDKMWIGQSENNIPFSEQKISLQAGDTIFMFSDGYKDQFGGGKGKKLKHKDFVNMLIQNSDKTATDQRGMLSSFLKEWKGNLEQTDDICVAGIKIT